MSEWIFSASKRCERQGRYILWLKRYTIAITFFTLEYHYKFAILWHDAIKLISMPQAYSKSCSTTGATLALVWLGMLSFNTDKIVTIHHQLTHSNFMHTIWQNTLIEQLLHRYARSIRYVWQQLNKHRLTDPFLFFRVPLHIMNWDSSIAAHLYINSIYTYFKYTINTWSSLR